METKDFLVKNEFLKGTIMMSDREDFSLWYSFINHLNNNEDGVRRRGNEYGAYYGVINGKYDSFSPEDIQGDDPRIISLNQAKDILDFEYDDYVVLHDGTINLLSDSTYVDCMDSMYEDQWIRSDESREICSCYGGGVAHEDEVAYVYDGDNAFVESCRDSYDIVWSDYNGYYVDTNDDYVHNGIITRGGSTGWFYNEDYVYVGSSGLYYANDRIAEAHNVFYDEDEGEWCVRSSDSIRGTNADYHSGLERVDLSGTSVFKVGFEIEKEDSEAGNVHYRQLYDRTHWCKEKDGSLDSDTGFELISPVYDLYGSKFESDIKKDGELIQLINADKSSNCGGHIHISSTIHTTEQLFESLSGFYPLLYSLYNGRLDRTYCQAKKNHEYYRKDKYSAVYIRVDTVEFRIFSAVSSVSNLLWRRDLLRIMCDNLNKSEVDVLRMLLNQKSRLYRHLRLVYSQEKLIDKISLFVDYSRIYCNKVIPKPNIDRLKKNDDNLGTSNELGA